MDSSDDDAFTSVTWDRRDDPAVTKPSSAHAGALGDIAEASTSAVGGGVGSAILARGSREEEQGEKPTWHGYLMVQVCDPRKENEGTKEMFVSYGIRAEVRSGSCVTVMDLCCPVELAAACTHMAESYWQR